ncbi:hypothetical protein [Pseudodesulfovibrio sp.]|uniref:hypothetical protein n=1 Tax=unclassified Pseudodesulfovibrio TaxID=2661612 RepID=UPI003AFFC034
MRESSRTIIREPGRFLVDRFLSSGTISLLFGGAVLSLTELGLLLFSAYQDGTFHIENGIGLLRHYAIFTFLVGDVFLLYWLKKYIDIIHLFNDRLQLTKLQKRIVEERLALFKSNITFQTPMKYLYIGFLLVGALFWFSNMIHHISGNTVNQWGRLTFDAYQYKYGFYCTRIHLFLSWILIFPFFAFATICSTLTIVTIIREMDSQGVLDFDLLHNDKCGGYSFIGDAQIYFNFMISICYIEVSSVVFISKEITLEQLFIYVLLTCTLFLGNSLILYNSSQSLKIAREKVLEVYKYGLQEAKPHFHFEIYRYCLNEVGYKPFSRYSKHIIHGTKLVAFVISFGFQIEKIMKIDAVAKILQLSLLTS